MDPLALFRLDGKAAVLTGASSGLGVGFARALSAVGASLVLAARRIERLDALAAELRETGTSVVTVKADIAVPSDCRAVAAAAADAFGRIDVLVNNAGVGGSVPAHRQAPEDFASVIDVNLNGAFYMAQACAPSMPPGSAIVNIASVLGHIAPQFPNAAYAASKAGLMGLTRDLANEWTRRRGIRVNALCPGYLATELTADGQDKLQEMVSTHSMVGRFGEQAELDTALIFLASPASSYVTGTSLIVDGGMAAM